MVKISNAKVSKSPKEITALIPKVTKGVAKSSNKADTYASKSVSESKDLRNPLWRDVSYLGYSTKTYDFDEFNRAEDIDAYISTSIRLTTELCMKQGFSFTGTNAELAIAIQTRLNQIARNSRSTMYELVDQLITGLAKFSNGFLILVRKESDTYSRFKPFKLRGKMVNPIVGMFYTDPQNMTPVIENGRIVKWEFSSHNALSSGKTFDSNDVFHVKWNKKGDEVFGTPWLLPALDDIKVLRRMQEYIQMLISKHLFPIYQYKVGTEKHPAMEFENGTSEVRTVEAMIGDLPAEGCIFTNHRHEIVAIDQSSATLDANEYLNYFDNLALSACGLSGVDVGRGDTSNKSTAAVMNQARTHRCNRIQRSFTEQFNSVIVSDLLMSLGVNIFDLDNTVTLKFPEVDVEEKRAHETHQIQLFNAGLITHDEARSNIGQKPFSSPDEWENTMQNTVGRVVAQQGHEATLEQQKQAAVIKNVASPANKANPGGKTKPKVSKNS